MQFQDPYVSIKINLTLSVQTCFQLIICIYYVASENIGYFEHAFCLISGAYLSDDPSINTGTCLALEYSFDGVEFYAPCIFFFIIHA